MVRVEQAGTVTNFTSGTALATCPAGKTLIGGGGRISSTAFYLNESWPTTANSWRVFVVERNGANGSTGFEAYAICATVG